MAKLTGVQTIDMTNGEITKVAYNGDEYAKVENGDVGDIAVIIDGWGSQSDGEFYVVTEISSSCGNTYAHIVAEYSGANGNVERMHYFRKISAQASPTIADVSAKVDAIDARVTALEGGKVADPIAESLTHNGVAYTLVDRKAQEGDVVVFTENTSPYFTNGKVYGPVYDIDQIYDNMDDNLTVYFEDLGRTEENVLVYAQKAKSLKVGDYARVISVGGPMNFTEIGDIVRIEDSAILRGYLRLEYTVLRNGKRGSVVNYEFAKATDEEVAEAKAKAEAIRKEAIFTQAGRKPNEYRKGDIVGYDSIKYGQVVIREVTAVEGDEVVYYSEGFGKDGVLNVSERLSLIATVESRLDRN